MKSLTLVITLFIACNCNAQPVETDSKEYDQGSNVSFSEITEQLQSNLELLGRVWGFLKYHHPIVGEGNCNWDYELFRILPQFVETATPQDRDAFLVNWIDQLGTVPICKNCKPTSNEAFLKPDLKWLQEEGLSSNLKQKLLYIYDNRYQGDHYHISMAGGVGNPQFKNESPYANIPYPDTGFRLLALYRYWNMINYFFPNKHLTDKNWNQVLKEYIPIFINSKSELAYEFAAIQLIGEVKDTHANLRGGADKINEWKGLFYPPIHVRFIENQLVVTDYYDRSLKEQVGLELGDIITKIEEKSIDQLIEAKQQFYPASNRPTMLRNMSYDLLRSNRSSISITYFDKNRVERSSELQLFPKDSIKPYRGYRKNEEKCYQLLENNIGYITLASIKDEDISKIKDELGDTKGIIIDIRNYPSSFVPFKLGSFFISSTTKFVKFREGNSKNPGEFNFTGALGIRPSRKTYQGKLVVLVNELSQSQAEYTAMAFRAGENTQIIGSTTAGADGNVSSISLPGGLSTMISGIGVYYPDGTETQRIGIVPDIEVQPTISGIRHGRDELMEAAIRLINQ